jgi:hypothetical protein
VADAYPEGKSDLFAAFILRCLEFAEKYGYVGMLTMHSFMFISSYQKLREEIRRQAVIDSMAHCGPALFDVGNPGTLQTTAFVLRKEPEAKARADNEGTYFRLVHEPDSEAKRRAFEQPLRDGSLTYRVAQRRFDAIPGSPWVYWISNSLRRLFETLPGLGDAAQPKHGMSTGHNFRFLRLWWEVNKKRVSFGCSDRDEAQTTGKRWFPYMKGGGYRKWCGNQEFVVNYWNNAEEMQAGRESGEVGGHRHDNRGYYFREGVTYSYLTSASFSARYSPGGFVFDVRHDEFHGFFHAATVRQCEGPQIVFGRG